MYGSTCVQYLGTRCTLALAPRRLSDTGSPDSASIKNSPEVVDGNAYPITTDTDGDGVLNYLDPDLAAIAGTAAAAAAQTAVEDGLSPNAAAAAGAAAGNAILADQTMEEAAAAGAAAAAQSNGDFDEAADAVPKTPSPHHTVQVLSVPPTLSDPVVEAGPVTVFANGAQHRFDLTSVDVGAVTYVVYFCDLDFTESISTLRDFLGSQTFEWAGTFDVTKHSTLQWIAQATNGWADMEMKIIVVAARQSRVHAHWQRPRFVRSRDSAGYGGLRQEQRAVHRRQQ